MLCVNCTSTRRKGREDKRERKGRGKGRKKKKGREGKEKGKEKRRVGGVIITLIPYECLGGTGTQVRLFTQGDTLASSPLSFMEASRDLVGLWFESAT